MPLLSSPITTPLYSKPRQDCLQPVTAFSASPLASYPRHPPSRPSSTAPPSTIPARSGRMIRSTPIPPLPSTSMIPRTYPQTNSAIRFTVRFRSTPAPAIWNAPAGPCGLRMTRFLRSVQASCATSTCGSWSIPLPETMRPLPPVGPMSATPTGGGSLPSITPTKSASAHPATAPAGILLMSPCRPLR